MKKHLKYSQKDSKIVDKGLYNTFKLLFLQVHKGGSYLKVYQSKSRHCQNKGENKMNNSDAEKHLIKFNSLLSENYTTLREMKDSKYLKNILED